MSPDGYTAQEEAKKLLLENQKLRKALEHYIDMTTLSVPDWWDISGAGGWPTTEELVKEDIGDVAREALGI